MLRKLQMNERELERMEERAEAAELYVNADEKLINALFTKSPKMHQNFVPVLFLLIHIWFLISVDVVTLLIWIDTC